MSPILRVLLADAHRLLMDAVEIMLSHQPDLRVEARVSTLEDAQGLLSRGQPNVLLIDLALLGSEPAPTLTETVRLSPGTRVLICAGPVDSKVQSALLDAGAWRVIRECERAEVLLRAIRGQSHPTLTNVDECADVSTGARTEAEASRSGNRSLEDAALLSLLTSRELEVLRLLGQGRGRTEVAEVLTRSPKTVDAHRASIMDKTGIRSTVGLVLFAVRAGLVEP